ncbi:MAG: hypothetical protein IPK82_36305 [Polyangiaceae bacterium]|nr:hypothetical protein [Polyangiaceae bacterium]
MDRKRYRPAVWAVTAWVAWGVGCAELLGLEKAEEDKCAPAGCGATAGSGGNGGGGTGGAPLCTPNETRSCYSGPTVTEGVGNCLAGTETCAADGQSWGTCVGEITPQAEAPSVFGDEACDGYIPGETLCARLFGDGANQVSLRVVGGNDGSFVVAGVLNGAIDFGPKVLVGQDIIFVAQLNAYCEVIWATQIGGSTQSRLGDVVINDQNEIIVAGSSGVSFSIGTTPVSAGIFLVKLSGIDGTPVWSASCATPSTASVAHSVATNSTGDIFVGGSYWTSIDCGQGAKAGTGSADGFVAKFDGTSGGLSWLSAYGTTLNGYQEITALALDPAGQVVGVGTFENGVTVAGQNLVAVGDRDTFVLRLGADGSVIWVKQFGGSLGLFVEDVAVDGLGAAIVTGAFTGTIELPTLPDLTNLNAFDGFVFKLDASGTPLWAWSFGDSTEQAGSRVAVDSEGDVILAGRFQGTLSLNGAAPLNASAYADGFVAKIKGQDGAHVWSRAFEDADYGIGAAPAPDRTILVSGTIGKAVDYGTGLLMPKGDDIFVLHLAP